MYELIAYEAPKICVDVLDDLMHDLGLEEVMTETFNFGPTEQFFGKNMTFVLYGIPNLSPNENMYVGVQEGVMPIDDGENKHYPSGMLHSRTVVSIYGAENSPSLCELIIEKLTGEVTHFSRDLLFPQERDFQFYM